MFGSSWKGGSLAGAILLLAAPAAGAVDATRLDLLAGEAVSVMGRAAAAPSRLGLVVLIGIPLATMLSAYLGTYLGIRGLSFGSLRTADGWREVAYRFRSEEPMTVGKDVIKRMSGVLDDIEELGKNIRTRSAKPAREDAPASADTVEAMEAPAAGTARETPKKGRSGNAKPSGTRPGRRTGRK
ncbi:hypothetical protein K8I85_09825, partial [bacterium]|nr:hypothetical protein [bacterium]